MIDVHCHILWDTDDGAINLEEAKKMCRVSAEQGVKLISATSHYILQERELNCQNVDEKVEILNQYCKENNLDLKIVNGCECLINPMIHKYIEDEKIITINNSKYLLIEFPMEEMPYYADQVIYRILLKGITPIIAHPERYSFVRKNPNLIYELIEKGCIIQVNAGSFLGYFGESVKRMAFSLLKHNMVHLIGSDAHSAVLNKRGICLKEAYEAISNFTDKIIDTETLNANALSVIENKEIMYAEPIKYISERKESNKSSKKIPVWYKLARMFLS